MANKILAWIVIVAILSTAGFIGYKKLKAHLESNNSQQIEVMEKVIAEKTAENEQLTEENAALREEQKAIVAERDTLIEESKLLNRELAGLDREQERLEIEAMTLTSCKDQLRNAWAQLDVQKAKHSLAIKDRDKWFGVAAKNLALYEKEQVRSGNFEKMYYNEMTSRITAQNAAYALEKKNRQLKLYVTIGGVTIVVAAIAIAVF